MKNILISLVILVSIQSAFGIDLSKICYSTVDNTEFCLNNAGSVQVLVYNAGWCPSCNEEIAEITVASQQFKEKRVIFASLSGEGWQSGDYPDTAFLKEWKDKHRLPTASNFVIAGKYRDFGKNFDPPGFIPYVLILDQKGMVTKSGELGLAQITDELRRLLL